MASTMRDMKIKTSTCKRIVKELHSYEKEVEREAAKVAEMKDKGADPYDLKQQDGQKLDFVKSGRVYITFDTYESAALDENVLAESRMMIPDRHKRLEAALADLKSILVELEESNQKEGVEIEEAQKVIAEVEQLFRTDG